MKQINKQQQQKCEQTIFSNSKQKQPIRQLDAHTNSDTNKSLTLNRFKMFFVMKISENEYMLLDAQRALVNWRTAVIEMMF